MLSKISIICTAIGYLLFFFTENLIALPIFLIIAAVVIAAIDLVALYKKDKLIFSDFVKEAFRTSWGSSISLIAGLFFIWLLIIYG